MLKLCDLSVQVKVQVFSIIPALDISVIHQKVSFSNELFLSCKTYCKSNLSHLVNTNT